MKKLTILHTIETSGPGGAENVLLTLAANLSADRFQSIVLVNEPGWLEDRLHDLGIPFVRVRWNRWYDGKLPRAIAGLVRSQGVDLIHSHLPDQNFYASVAGALAGCPTLATYHGPVELGDSHQLRGALKLKTVRRFASATSVVCDRVGNMLRELGFSADKVVRIYNGIQVSRYRSTDQKNLHRELGVGPEMLLVGMVGNVRAPKGHEYFIRAARIVADRFPNVFFTISGDLNPTLAPPLFELVEKLNLSRQLKFLGFRRDVPQLLNDLDAFVLPSISEGFPIVVLEAMAASRPVIATRCGGVDEMITDGVDGLLVPVADAHALAEGICSVLGDRDRSSAMAAAARHRVEREFSLESMISSYELLYERCCQGQESVAQHRQEVEA